MPPYQTPEQRLLKLIAGLNFPSEVDSPWSVVHLPVPEGWPQSKWSSIQWGSPFSRIGTMTPVETIAIPDFFAGSLMKIDKRYPALKSFFQDVLVDPVVYRVGDAKCCYVVLGKKTDAELLGIVAQAVETG